jgi:putative flippase GtrA
MSDANQHLGESFRRSLVSVASAVDEGRVRRFALFGAVGASGVVVDLLVVVALLGAGAGVLVANAAAWIVAASTNFVGNYLFTYRRPEGSIPAYYARYVTSRGATFCLRGVAVLIFVSHFGFADVEASLVGVFAAALSGFAFIETVVFGGENGE